MIHVGATPADSKQCPGPVQLAFRQGQHLFPSPQWRMPASLHMSALTSVVLARKAGVMGDVCHLLKPPALEDPMHAMNVARASAKVQSSQTARGEIRFTQGCKYNREI